MNSSLKIEDCLDAFRAIEKNDLSLVLVGGQACSFYGLRYKSNAPELNDLLPIASKDVNFFGGCYEGELLAKALGCEFKRSPRKGGLLGLSLGIIQSDLLEIEILGKVHGLGDREVKKSVLNESFKDTTVAVLHPIPLYEAKMGNLIHLDQTLRQDAKHVEVMERVIPLFLRDLIKVKERETELLKSLERLYDFSLGHTGLCASQQGRKTVLELLPDELLQGDFKSEKLNHWQRFRLPQWLGELKKRGVEPVLQEPVKLS
jgi:hypothetical protein